ncbi:MAG: hypothetical protein P1U34_12520 [Coxiellaceae bacterium]|nr:hypothetical protein [Coxiellaceae bacterium]
MYKSALLSCAAIIALGTSSLAYANLEACDSIYSNPIPTRCIANVKLSTPFGVNTNFQSHNEASKQLNINLQSIAPTPVTGTVSWLECSSGNPGTLKQTQFSLPAGGNMDFHADVSSCPADKRMISVYQQKGTLMIDASAQ